MRRWKRRRKKRRINKKIGEEENRRKKREVIGEERDMRVRRKKQRRKRRRRRRGRKPGTRWRVYLARAKRASGVSNSVVYHLTEDRGVYCFSKIIVLTASCIWSLGLASVYHIVWRDLSCILHLIWITLYQHVE